MKISLRSWLVVVPSVLLVGGCAGGGAGGSSTPVPTETAFIYNAISFGGAPETLYYATVSDPSHPVALHTLPNANLTFGSAAIDPTGSKIYYNDPAAPKTIRVVNKDGTGDQVFYTTTHENVYPHAFNLAGKMLVNESEGGSVIYSQMDVNTKALTPSPTIGGQVQPSWYQWKRDGSEFAFFAFDGNTSHFQVWKAVVKTNKTSVVADDVYGGQFAPDGTVLGPYQKDQGGLARYSDSGVLKAIYPVNRPFVVFLQVGSTGFLENGDNGPAGDRTIEYYKYDKSAPIRMTPNVASANNVRLLDAVTYPVTAP